MGDLAAAVRGLADEITATARPATNLGFATGQVDSITAVVVTVLVLGDKVQVPYYGALPAVGATVGVLFIEGSPVILGVPNGVPTF